MRSEGYSTWSSVCVCVSVCLLSHISPTERLFVMKTLSRTQRATKVKKFVAICLKLLRSRVMPRNMSEKANMLIFRLTRGQLSPLGTQRSARGCPTIVNNIRPCPKRCLLMLLARVGARTECTTRYSYNTGRGQFPRTRIGIVHKTHNAVCAEGLHFSAFHYIIFRFNAVLSPHNTPTADNIISSVKYLAPVSGQAFLLILALITIIILTICLIKVYARKHKHSESTYDKLWVHTNQSSDNLHNNKAKRREYEYDNFARLSQTTRMYDTVQDIQSQSNMLQSFTLEKQGAENMREGAIVSNQTSIEIETELIGNGEGLYHATGQLPRKIAANVEEENNYCLLVKPSSHSAGKEKLGLQSTEGMYCEVRDEQSVIQTHKQDAVPQSGEYSMITMSHGIKKSMNNDDMVPPSTSYSLTSPNEEDTGSSSGFEEGSNDCSQSQKATHQSSKPPVEEDFSKDMHVEGGSSQKAIPPTKKPAAVTKTPQEGKFPEYATVAMNRKTKKPRNVKAVEQIYNVVVNQLAARKASSSTPPHVEPYAVCTLPAPSKVPRYQCAVGKDSPAATDEDYKQIKVASE